MRRVQLIQTELMSIKALTYKRVELFLIVSLYNTNHYPNYKKIFESPLLLL